MNIRRIGRLVLLVLVMCVSVALGFFGLLLLISPLGLRETMVSRFIVVLIYYALTSFVLGILYPSGWTVATMVGWGALLLGLGSVVITLLRTQFDQLILAIAPVASYLLTVICAHAGAKIGRRGRYV